MKLLSFFIPLWALLMPQQELQISGFYLENQSITYKHVFNVDAMDEADIVKNLNSYLPTLSGFSNIQINGNVVTGRFDKLIVNYKKYGGKWKTTWVGLNHPLNGRFTIQVKDNKYRLFITEIESISKTSPYTTYDLTNEATNKGRDKFTINKTVLSSLEYLDMYFIEKFTLNPEVMDTNW